MALIQRMESYKYHIPIPRWNLRSDEDITRIANRLLSVIPARLFHIHSHQDEKLEWQQLSMAAQLNIIADEQASHHRSLMDGPASDVINLAQAQLRINDIAITRDSQRAILHAASSIPLRDYYQRKLGWSNKVFDLVSWTAHRKALISFNASDQTRILKFAHGWLPTQSRLHKEGAATSPRCKLCNVLYEKNIHRFSCTHPGIKKLQENIQTYLLKQYHDHGCSELINIIQLALEECPQNANWTPSIGDTSPDWRIPFQDQSEIGWIQILNGRIANSMIKQMDAHYATLNINLKTYSGERWARKLIINIWTTLLQLWNHRNKLLYEVENQKALTNQRDKLETRIRRCYLFQHQLSATDRRQWFDQDLQEKLQQDVHHLKTWLTLAERLIRIAKREQEKRPKSSILMHRYLGINDTQYQTNTTHAPPNPRAYPQDLNPD
jgi:hypothetical protein